MMRRIFLGNLLVLAACALLSSCAEQASSVAFEATEFLPALYKKTMCFGPCPAFTFEVAESGSAKLSIDRPIRSGPLSKLAPGPYHAQMTDAYAWNTSIAVAAEAVQYSNLDSLYDNSFITDLPATITEWNGKSVTNRYNGPDLTTLYAAFDEAMVALNWRPIETK